MWTASSGSSDRVDAVRFAWKRSGWRLVHVLSPRTLPQTTWRTHGCCAWKPFIPAHASHSTWFVSHTWNRCFAAYDVEWFFNPFSARARVSNARARTQKYLPDRLLSLRVMDRSIFSGSCAMSIVFDATVHCVNVMSERGLGACYPLPCQLHTNSKFVV